MTTITPRGPQRRSGVERRTVDIEPRVLGKRERRSGEERRSGKDRRRYDLADLDERGDLLHLDDRWDQLLEAVRAEFWRLPQDPDAVFEPRRDELKLRARIDRPGQDAEWLAVTLTSHQVLNGDLAGIASQFVALYWRECEGPTNSTRPENRF